jgi:hypothetical protein
MPNEISGEVPQPKPKKSTIRSVQSRRLDSGEESLGGYEPYQINKT